MTKRSGFAVKITAFIEAEFTDPAQIGRMAERIGEIRPWLDERGFIQTAITTNFMLSREVPDAPVAGQSTLTVTMEPEGLTMPKPIGIAAPLERMPEIPAAQRRS